MQTKIILEMCCNHQGEIGYAKQMINDAEKLGVWAVKFQKRNLDQMSEDIKNKKVSGINYFGKTYLEHKRHLEFNIEQLKDLKNYAEAKNLVFMCTPFDAVSLNELIYIGCRHIKLASQYFTNTKMYTEILKNNTYKLYVSNGMHTWNEIIQNPWLNIIDVLMYCNSIYPAQLNECNMETVFVIKSYVRSHGFPCNVGYSSHEIEGKAIKYAVLFGAEYIERHYTLNKNLKGHDHKISSDKYEIIRIIQEIQETEEIRGVKYNLNQKESEIRNKYKWCFDYV